MTLSYAAKAALIRNRPVKNDDPQTKLILELKQQVKTISMELLRANQYIEQVCTVSGQPIRKFGAGLLPNNLSEPEQTQRELPSNSKTLVTKRSAARLIDRSPYSSASKQAEGSNEFVTQ